MKLPASVVVAQHLTDQRAQMLLRAFLQHAEQHFRKPEVLRVHSAATLGYDRVPPPPNPLSIPPFLCLIAKDSWWMAE